MRFGISIILFILFASIACAQTGQISGRILDSKTLEPLPFANIFINNTTIGTNANEDGTFLLKNVPIGSVEIIYSFIGYQSYQIRQVIRQENATAVVVKLIPLVEQLSEVEVRSSRDKTWDKQLKKFEKVFLGEGPFAAGCKIINPWVIDFMETPKLLVAKASSPLEIENKSLGYRLFFHLKNFKYTGESYSIVGNTRFEELPTIDQEQALQWEKNRESVYQGSLRHLMKSILEKRMNGEGFVLYADKEQDKSRTNNFSYELEHNLIKYDTIGIVTNSPSPNEYQVFLKGKIEIHNVYELSRAGFYKDISTASSWLEVKGNYVKVNKEGIIQNSSDIIISGDMSSARASQLLPLDYVRGRIIPMQSRQSISAERLQEKVYLQTDKPYYYPGENIWLSGFMNYQIPNMADTLSKVLYVDLIDAQKTIIKSVILKIDSGRTSGDLKLDAFLTPGNYILRGYTEWMRNYGLTHFFYKPIPVIDLYDKMVENSATPGTLNNKLKIVTDKLVYKKREKVKMTFVLNDDEDVPVQTSLSISVTDMQQVVRINENYTIVKDFNFAEEFPSDAVSKFIYPIEKGLGLEGVILNQKNKPEKTQVTIVQGNFENIFQVLSNNEGRFSLTGLSFYDSAQFGIQLEKGKIVWNKKDIPGFPAKLPTTTYSVVHAASAQRQLYQAIADTSTLLGELEVKSRKVEPNYENPYGKPDYYIQGETLSTLGPNLASAIQSKVPGYKLIFYSTHWVLINSRGEYEHIDIPTQSSSNAMTSNNKSEQVTRAPNFNQDDTPAEPVLLIDNVQLITGSGETVGDRLYSMNTSMIDHIEVSGMIHSNTGTRGSNGLIAVYTKRAQLGNFKSMPVIKLKGFDSTKEFESPNYDDSSIRTRVIDQRSTLYWNPIFSIGKSPAELTFFTSDLSGKYRVTVEGVTQKGIPIRSEAIIEVEQ